MYYLACNASATEDTSGGGEAATARRKKRETRGPPSQANLGAVSTYADFNTIFTKAFMYFETENRQQMGHEFNNMIVDCTFKQRDCLVEA